MTGLTVESITRDLGTNPRFVRWLARKMDASVLAGAAEVERAHLAILVGWASKPAFFAKDIIDIGRLYQAREIRVGGPHAWKWKQVNYGGSTIKKGPIVGKYMRFLWNGENSKDRAGVGNSYSAATDTQKPGAQVGNLTTFFNINKREVKARDMIGNVWRNNRQDVFSAMKRGFDNG